MRQGVQGTRSLGNLPSAAISQATTEHAGVEVADSSWPSPHAAVHTGQWEEASWPRASSLMHHHFRQKLVLTGSDVEARRFPPPAHRKCPKRLGCDEGSADGTELVCGRRSPTCVGAACAPCVCGSACPLVGGPGPALLPGSGQGRPRGERSRVPPPSCLQNGGPRGPRQLSRVPTWAGTAPGTYRGPGARLCYPG